MKYIEFYEVFLEYCRSTQGLFNREYGILMDYMDTGYAGKGWDHYDPNLAPIFWPIEEATWLRCVQDSGLLKRDILNSTAFLNKHKGLTLEADILEDLVNFQVFLLSTMDRKEPVKIFTAKFPWKDFLVGGERDLGRLTRDRRDYSWKNKVTLADKAEWCYRAIWVGRNQGNYKCHPEFLLEEVPTSAGKSAA